MAGVADRIEYYRYNYPQLTMKTSIGLILFLLCLQAYPAETSTIPSQLRGGIKCDEAVIAKAVELNAQGWVYIMPKPYDSQAGWNNPDTNSTWWVGYWTNKARKDTSQTVPAKDATGTYVGDGEGKAMWQSGGPPMRPNALEWLCSKFGGIKPKSS